VRVAVTPHAEFPVVVATPVVEEEETAPVVAAVLLVVAALVVEAVLLEGLEQTLQVVLATAAVTPEGTL